MNTSFTQNDRKHVSRVIAGRRQAPGFTLMEILIAIALIVTITAIAVTSLENIYGNGQKEAATQAVTHEYEAPLFSYKLQTGSYPTTAQGLQALLTAPANVTGWAGPYLNTKDVPLDPWKQPYHYAYPSTHGQKADKYDIWSSGPDQIDGTADDIGNW